jgi:hypothetical protein
MYHMVEVRVGGWIVFKMSELHAVLYRRLRDEIDDLLQVGLALLPLSSLPPLPLRSLAPLTCASSTPCYRPKWRARTRTCRRGNTS